MSHRIVILTILALLLLGLSAKAQNRLVSSAGAIEFTSDAPLELKEANSTQLNGIIDTESRQFAFSIRTITFEGFNSSLQRDHFNENYMETEMYPESTFAGKIIEEVDFTKDGNYQVRTKGTLLIHGVEQSRIIKSKINIKNGEIKVTSSFSVPLEDHVISIPKVVNKKIATEIVVTVSATFQNKP